MSQIAICSALEIALEALPGVIPVAQILSSTNGVFLTAAPHGLLDGMDIKITDHTSLTVGRFEVTGSAVTTFKVRDKVTQQIVVIGNGTGGTVKAQLTAWENVGFKPLNGVPFQKVNFVYARPDNITMGDAFYRERGYMQVMLYYPEKTGRGPAMSRAELIRKAYPRGASFSKDGYTVKIDKTAEIIPVGVMDESYIVYVRVPFYADILN